MTMIDPAIALLVGRVIFGGFFLMSAYNHFANTDAFAGYAQSKGMPHARLAVQATGLLLLIGGLGYVLGAYTEWAALALVVFLVGVSFKMHAFWAIPDAQAAAMERVNFTKNMALLGAVLMSLAIPTPWAYAWMM